MAKTKTEMYKKHCIILIILLMASIFVQAQEIQYKIVESHSDGLTIQVDFPGYKISPVYGTSFQQIEMEEAFPIEDYGKPELLKSAFSLIIPEDARPTATIIHSTFKECPDINLVPSKGRLSRRISPDSIPFWKGYDYLNDRFLCEDSVHVDVPYRLRDFYGVSIQCFPFAYNPVRQCLKVFSSITVKVDFNSRCGSIPTPKVEKSFDPIYSRHFLNYGMTKSPLLDENGKILILTPTMFYAEMLPFVEWKTKMGFPTEMICLDSIGTDLTYVEVKNFIRDYYRREKMSYVILVGDNLQCPPIRLYGKYSDNYYAEIEGDDYYPDIILGRISAETIEDVRTQVRRFIEYEQNPPQTQHFPVFCGIASSEGPGDSGEYDYTHIRNIDSLLQNYTYSKGFELFENSRGGLDEEGTPTSDMMDSVLNQGVGIVNYCGHGSSVSWKTTSFNSQHISSLKNVGKLPFIISVACENGLYVNRTCFAESWMRATQNGEPVGAVSVLMSTIEQPWKAPMCAQDWMMKFLTGSNGVHQQYTLGGIIFNGLIEMLDVYQDYKVSQTWLLFGDPTLAVRTMEPGQLSVDYDKEIKLGSPTANFSSKVENAKIVLSLRNQIIASGNINEGTLTLSLPTTLTLADTLVMLASAPNYIPFESRILVVQEDGPYVSLKKIELKDNNGNGWAEPGESVYLNAYFYNYGTKTAEHCTAVLSTADPYIELQNVQRGIESIPADSMSIEEMAFSFKVADSVPAAHNAHFYMTMDCGEHIVTEEFDILLHSPQLVVQSLWINDSCGNNDNSLDRGETVLIECTLMNAGNGFSDIGNAKYKFPDGKLNIVSRYKQQVPSLEPGAQYVLKVKAKVGADVEANSKALIQVLYRAGKYQVAKEFYLPIADDFLTGVDEFSKDGILVFPNPTSEYVWIKMPEEIFSRKGMVEYQIFDTFGRLLKQSSMEAPITLVLMQSFSNGVYYLKVVDDKKEIKTFKIIKR